MNFYRLLSLLVIVCHSFFANAQLERRYSTYNVENGLAQNSVWDIHHDYRGFLWFGTADGINRFDGYTMHHYKKNALDSNSIHGISFFEFKELPNNELWICHDQGVSVYNRIKDNFDNILKSKYYYRFLGIHNNQVWLTEERFRIVVIDIKSRKVVKSITDPRLNEYAYHTTSNAIKIDDHFITTLNGNELLLIDCKNGKIRYSDKEAVSPELFRFIKTGKSTFIALSSLYKCFYEFSFINNKISYKKTPVKNYKPYLRTTGVYEWNNSLYATSLEGYYIIDKNNYETKEYIENFGSSNKSFNYIQHLDVDRSNNLYISTNGMGVKMYSLYLNKFPHLRTPNERTNMVKSILKTKDGKIITGIYNEGFVVYYPNNTYKQFVYPSAYLKNYSFKSVLGMINFSDEEVLMMYSDYMILFNHYTNTKKIIKNSENNEFQFYPCFVRNGKSINYYINDQTNSYFKTIDEKLNIKTLFKLNKYTATCFLENEKTILIGTLKDLLIRNSSDGSIRKCGMNTHIKSIYKNKQGRIFVATVNGLYEINKLGETLKKYDVNAGLPDDFLYCVLEDNNGHLWMSHNKGLSKLNLATSTFTNYSVKDGLQSNEFNTGAFYKDENGILYFGGVNGINIIDPNKIIFNKNEPKIAINQINLFDEPYLSDTSYNEITQLNLDYFENTLSFDFSALEFTDPIHNTYKYTLSGYDKGWINSENRHFARYANLPPGNYTFSIMAANADGIWSSKPKTINIIIREPFWQSTWFYIIIGLLIVVLIIALIVFIIYRQRLKLKRQLKLQYELEQERLRIARDLHDNVGAHLSYLISNLDWMISHPEQLSAEEERKRLENLTETGRQAILTLRQTIWAINNQALYIEDFADKYKTFAKKMLDFSAHINIHFEENIIGKQKLSPGITLHLFRICQEALNNILKHADAKNIWVKIESNEEFLFKFCIRDDGKGFDTSFDYSKDHFGLVIMQERAKECHAELNITSELGKGTELCISIRIA